MTISGSIIVNKQIPLQGQYNFINIGDGLDIKKYSEASFNCILVKYLRPDYVVLLPAIDLIIAENGGALSHLAMVALAEGKHVVRVNTEIDLPEKGYIKVDQQGSMVSINEISENRRYTDF